MKETKFPEKWYIERNRENFIVINNYLNNLYFKNGNSYTYYAGYIYSEIVHTNDTYGAASKDIIDGYTEITFQQFKENVLMKKEEKKIKYYTLKDAKFEEAARAVVGAEYKWNVGENIFNPNSPYYNKYKELGVLDLWFTPTYEEEITLIALSSSGGDFVLQVTSKGIFYSPECVYLNVQDLENIITPMVVNLQTNLTTVYKCIQKITHVDLGCKKNVPVDDIMKVLTKYYSLKDK